VRRNKWNFVYLNHHDVGCLSIYGEHRVHLAGTPQGKGNGDIHWIQAAPTALLPDLDCEVASTQSLSRSATWQDLGF
jgi:hypothetical protein